MHRYLFFFIFGLAACALGHDGDQTAGAQQALRDFFSQRLGATAKTPEMQSILKHLAEKLENRAFLKPKELRKQLESVYAKIAAVEKLRNRILNENPTPTYRSENTTTLAQLDAQILDAVEESLVLPFLDNYGDWPGRLGPNGNSIIEFEKEGRVACAVFAVAFGALGISAVIGGISDGHWNYDVVGGILLAIAGGSAWMTKNAHGTIKTLERAERHGLDAITRYRKQLAEHCTPLLVKSRIAEEHPTEDVEDEGKSVKTPLSRI